MGRYACCISGTSFDLSLLGVIVNSMLSNTIRLCTARDESSVRGPCLLDTSGFVIHCSRKASKTSNLRYTRLEVGETVICLLKSVSR